MMAQFDLQEAVVQRVQNAVHSLKKELGTAGVDTSAVVIEETTDGITVTVDKPARKSPRKADEARLVPTESEEPDDLSA